MYTDSKIILALSGYSAPRAALVELETEANILICSMDGTGEGTSGNEKIEDGGSFVLG